MTFAPAWQEARRRVDARLDAELARADPALAEAVGPELAGGKRVRPALLLLAHDALGAAQPARAEDCAVAVELVHTAILVHDDLIDGDAVRRGRPAAHARLASAGLAALAGDAALAWGLGLLPGPAEQRVLAAALAATWRGAWMEARGRGAREEVARLKTGALFGASCALGAMAAGAGDARRADAQAYGETLGLAYQMADDAVDQPPGAPPPKALEARAHAFAAEARALAKRFPAGPPRAALLQAPDAVLAAALGAGEARP